jgi:hypothetical protein
MIRVNLEIAIALQLLMPIDDFHEFLFFQYQSLLLIIPTKATRFSRHNAELQHSALLKLQALEVNIQCNGRYDLKCV